MVREETRMKRMRMIAVAGALVLMGACSPGIYGKVQLFDAAMQPVPAAVESPEGTVINMINITTTIEAASSSVAVNAKGEFESEKDQIVAGKYKVEATRMGYETNTQTIEVSSGGVKVEFSLKKIKESKRKSVEGSTSDEDKIINPGEVNIQPPTM